MSMLMMNPSSVTTLSQVDTTFDWGLWYLISPYFYTGFKRQDIGYKFKTFAINNRIIV